MRLLELFAGTGNVGKAFSQYGWEVIGLDINPGHAIQSDILRWDYTVYPRDHFDCIHASPPCTQYSICRTSAKTPRDLEGADALVQRTLDILEYFKPAIFIIENPYTGLMKDRPLMAPLRDRMKTVCYCRYGMPYRKATSIWTNLDWTPRPMCTKADPCEHVLDGSHVTRAQTRNGWTTDQLYMLPQALCLELAAAASKMFCAPVLELLRVAPLPFEKRRRVRDNGSLRKRGMVLGIVCDYASRQLVVSKGTRRYPKLAASLCSFGRALSPGFPFTSIMVNQGASTLHVDKNNCGPSVLISLGDHTGGELWQYPGDVLEVHCKPTKCNGLLPHMTLPFEGERFSLVYYCINSSRSPPTEENRQYLQDLGFWSLADRPEPGRPQPLMDKARALLNGSPSDTLA